MWKNYASRLPFSASKENLKYHPIIKQHTLYEWFSWSIIITIFLDGECLPFIHFAFLAVFHPSDYNGTGHAAQF